MNVVAADSFFEKANIKVEFFNGQSVDFEIKTQSKEEVLKQADFVTLHVPAQKDFVIGEKEFELMKNGAVLVNCARGGVVDEVALLKALDSGKLAFAGLDVAAVFLVRVVFLGVSATVSSEVSPVAVFLLVAGATRTLSNSCWGALSAKHLRPCQVLLLTLLVKAGLAE